MSDFARALLYIKRNKKSSTIIYITVSLISFFLVGIFTIREMVLSSTEYLKSDMYDLKQSLVTLSEFLKMSEIAVIIFSAVIVTLMIFLRLNTRVREVGILYSIGIKIHQIYSQFIYEIIALMIVSIPITVTISIYLSKILGKKMILDTVKIVGKERAYDLDESIINATNQFIKNVQELSIDSNTIIIIVLKLIAVLVILFLISVYAGNYKIFKMKPREILSKEN